MKRSEPEGCGQNEFNDRNLLFSGVAAEVGVLGGGGEIVSVDRVI